MSSQTDGETCSSDEPIDLSVRQLKRSAPSNITSPLPSNVSAVADSSSSFINTSVPADTASTLLHPLIARTYGQLAAARYLLSTQATNGSSLVDKLIYERFNALAFSMDGSNGFCQLNDHRSAHQFNSPSFAASSASAFKLDQPNDRLVSILPHLLLRNRSGSVTDDVVSQSRATLPSLINRTLTSRLSGTSRPLTGRYVKHGTGASEATLASLRRMLELRSKERLGGQMIPQVKRGIRQSNCGTRRNKRK